MPSSVDDYLRRGDEMYSEQRKRIVTMEQEHQVRRGTMSADYARRVSDLAHEGAEALRKLDREHQRDLEVEHAKLEAIQRMRG